MFCTGVLQYAGRRRWREEGTLRFAIESSDTLHAPVPRPHRQLEARVH